MSSNLSYRVRHCFKNMSKKKKKKQEGGKEEEKGSQAEETLRHQVLATQAGEPSSDPRHLSLVTEISAGETAADRSHWLARPAKSVDFRLNERQSQANKNGGKQLGRYPVLTPGVSTHITNAT